MPIDTRGYYGTHKSEPNGLNCPRCGFDTLYQGTGITSSRLYECRNCGISYPVTNSVWLQERDKRVQGSRR